jgi:hypothetical protein
MVWNTYRMYVDSASGELSHLFIAQCAAIGVGVGTGAVVVSGFFSRVVMQCVGTGAGATRRKALLVWMGRNTRPLRFIKLLAIFQPNVLRVVQCRLCSLSTFSIPASGFFEGWRWMWVGDGVASLVIDGSMVVIGVLQHRHQHQALDSWSPAVSASAKLKEANFSLSVGCLPQAASLSATEWQ